MDELEKIDIIRERIGVSYKEARDILIECEEDVISALIKAEEKKSGGWGDSLVEKTGDAFNRMKTYIEKGNRTKVKVKNGEKTVVEFPVTVGAVGIMAVLASTQLAVVAGIGAVAAAAKKWNLEIEKPDDEPDKSPENKPRQ